MTWTNNHALLNLVWSGVRSLVRWGVCPNERPGCKPSWDWGSYCHINCSGNFSSRRFCFDKCFEGRKPIENNKTKKTCGDVGHKKETQPRGRGTHGMRPFVGVVA